MHTAGPARSYPRGQSPHSLPDPSARSAHACLADPSLQHPPLPTAHELTARQPVLPLPRVPAGHAVHSYEPWELVQRVCGSHAEGERHSSTSAQVTPSPAKPGGQGPQRKFTPSCFACTAVGLVLRGGGVGESRRVSERLGKSRWRKRSQSQEEKRERGG